SDDERRNRHRRAVHAIGRGGARANYPEPAGWMVQLPERSDGLTTLHCFRSVAGLPRTKPDFACQKRATMSARSCIVQHLHALVIVLDARKTSTFSGF